ncbi:MAG TPA: hemolysin family protein [Thermoanaerobaculia bacterium]|nr:hemolysin family protein [Thermoanaerobaculia bacterium]
MSPTLALASDAATAPPAAGGLNPWAGLGLAVLLIAANAFFVAAEFALVKVRPTQLEIRAGRGERRAKLARHMAQHLDAYISATQIGITLITLALGSVAEPAVAGLVRPLISWIPGVTEDLLHSLSLILALLAITSLHVLFGELTPKNIALRKAEATTLAVALPLYAFYKLAYPFIWLLNTSGNLILKGLGLQAAGGHEHVHNEEELRLLLASSSDEHLQEEKRELLDNVFELSNRVARQIMVPRGDVVYLSTGRSLEDNLRLARESGHTRYPLCEGDLDHVVGVVHIKDLFRTARPIESLTEVARKIPLIPETLSLDRVLRRMREERLHFAAVLDEYGGVSGIITLENVLEEIVGSIQDEFDVERPELVARGKDLYLVSGSMLIADLEQELGIELSDRDEDTVAGVVLSEIGRRPVEGDRAEVGPCQFEVVEVAGNRIKTLRMRLLSAGGEAGPED